ncbi:MAG: PfkB family carbohydrate kinase [Caldilineaceae bacterium]
MNSWPNWCKEDLTAHWSWAGGETRNCAILVGEEGGPETVINDRGGKISISEWLQFIQDIVAVVEGQEPAHLPQVDHRPISTGMPIPTTGLHTKAVCICGSLPPGTPPHAPADLVEALLATGTAVWVDSSGAALSHALEAKPTGLKINDGEAGTLLGQRLAYLDDAHEAARTIRRQGVAYVIITLGARGAVLHSPQGEYHLRAPHVQSISAVGSGDAFLAGFLVAHTRGLSDQSALAWAVAAGAANTLIPGGGIFARADFDDLLAQLQ